MSTPINCFYTTARACCLPQIGTHAKPEDLRAVQQYLNTCNRRVDVVSPAWLQLCHHEQRLVPADGRCRLQIGSLMRSGAGAATGGVLAAGPTRAAAADAGSGGGGVFANAASRGGFPGEAEKQLDGAWVPEYWHERPTDPLKLFDGCYFTLAAVQSHQADHEKALGHIRWGGGTSGGGGRMGRWLWCCHVQRCSCCGALQAVVCSEQWWCVGPRQVWGQNPC
jgi:hypothetical protein